jgi:50S ribosomal protein L16 3-hydroxylase
MRSAHADPLRRSKSYNPVMQRALLGGLTAAQFLRRHWQKKPLFVGQAIPRFAGVLSVDALFALAARNDVESRIVLRERGRWSLEHGPFTKSQRRALPARNWTLLVQGVNNHVAQADALLRRFDFIPFARLDDLMMSFAVPGGGVGPHVDSYDVFLLQGPGRRRWRVSRQRDLALQPALPLKILNRFRPQREWALDAGDMLYLPPQIAHEGTAIDACTTYSIGFRAPAAQELVIAFLDWLRDRIAVDGRYSDPGLAATREPARIGEALQRYGTATLSRVRWDQRDAARFLGCYLTEPKPAVRFEPPARALARTSFIHEAKRCGVRLDARTQLLYDKRHLFINGEAMRWPAAAAASALKQLANERCLASAEPRRSASLSILYDWYRDGFLHLD